MEKGAGKNILMLCYYYPPLLDVGCKRSVAFSKYLKEHGWKPVVISVKNPDKNFCVIGKDRPPEGIITEYSWSIINPYKLLGKANGVISRLMKLFGIELKRNYLYDVFCMPDIFFGWIPLTIIKSYQAIKKYDINIIYVSCTPYSSAIIGIILKYMTNKPLIIDFRDAYALDILSEMIPAKKPRIRMYIDKKIERKVINKADIFIVVTDEMRDLYVQQYKISKSKIYVINNGFDNINHKINKNTKYSKFTICYAGQYYLWEKYASSFFKALQDLKEKDIISKNNFQFIYYGDDSQGIKKLSESYTITDIIEVHNRVSYEEILSIIAKSHLYLIRVMKMALPTKLFEGISLNVPILALIPKGNEAETILNRFSPSSYVITDNSVEKISNAIIDAMEKYHNNQVIDNHVDMFLDEFSRKAQTQKLVKIIDEKLPNNNTRATRCI